jgi:hypothetical protein
VRNGNETRCVARVCRLDLAAPRRESPVYRSSADGTALVLVSAGPNKIKYTVKINYYD